MDHCIGTEVPALTCFLCDLGKKPLLDSLDELHLSSLSDEHNAQPDAPDATLHELHSKVAESHKPAQSPHKTDDSKSAVHHASSVHVVVLLWLRFPCVLCCVNAGNF